MRRRDFLKHLAWATGAFSSPTLLAPGCRQEVRRGRRRKKVLIIGAGLAGLSAAYELMRAGHDVVVFEAQDRPGGRVLTLRDGFADGLYAEAGATRIPNHHGFTLGYVEHFGLTLDPFRPPDMTTVCHVRGQRLKVAPGASVDWPHRLTPQERQLGRSGLRRAYNESALSELGDVTEPAWPPASLEKYDRMSRSEFWRSRGASTEAIELMTFGGFDDQTEPVSALFMLRNVALNQRRVHYSKIRGGNDLLPKAFAARLGHAIHFGAVVTRIERGAQGVTAVFQRAGSAHKMSGDYLICAVPFPVQRRIEVHPPFSVEKRRAIHELPYHSASKVFIQTRKRFWLEEGLDGFATTDLPIGDVWDMSCSQPGVRGILQAFPFSAHSRRVTAMPESERVPFALEQLARVYPGVREHHEGGLAKCWDEDRWAGGGTSFYRPGQMTSLLPYVSKPEGRVHFAGEHTSVWIDGWMQGALESGNRVAAEVNAAP